MIGQKDVTKQLIIIAGAPGTGKTYMALELMKRLRGYNYLALDTFKERYYDKHGFKDSEEKKYLDKLSMIAFYGELTKVMKSCGNIMIDYPFSYLQKDNISDLVEKYDYSVVTIRLEADLSLLYKRRIERDKEMDRHQGHLCESYYSKENPDEGKVHLISFEEFQRHVSLREYETFCLGQLIRVDVSDFKKIDYEMISERVKKTNLL